METEYLALSMNAEILLTKALLTPTGEARTSPSKLRKNET